MSEKKIDIVRLQTLTENAKIRIAKEKELEEKKKAELEALRAEKEGQRLGESIVKKLPLLLEKEAEKGNDSLYVLEHVLTPQQKKAAEIIISFCTEQGLKAEIQPYSTSDDPDGILVVSWKKD